MDVQCDGGGSLHIVPWLPPSSAVVHRVAQRNCKRSLRFVYLAPDQLVNICTVVYTRYSCRGRVEHCSAIFLSLTSQLTGFSYHCRPSLEKGKLLLVLSRLVGMQFADLSHFVVDVFLFLKSPDRNGFGLDTEPVILVLIVYYKVVTDLLFRRSGKDAAISGRSSSPCMDSFLIVVSRSCFISWHTRL